MRYHFFLHYGWFLQNFEKDFIPTLLHTTVAYRICFAKIVFWFISDLLIVGENNNIKRSIEKYALDFCWSRVFFVLFFVKRKWSVVRDQKIVKPQVQNMKNQIQLKPNFSKKSTVENK